MKTKPTKFNDALELVMNAVRAKKIPNSAGTVSAWLTIAERNFRAAKEALTGEAFHANRIANVMARLDGRAKAKSIAQTMRDIDSQERSPEQ